MLSERNLLFTTVLDAPGHREHRYLAKLFSSSLLRSIFDGQVVLERNFVEPVFVLERVGLKELHHELGDFLPENVKTRAHQARMENLLKHVEEASRYHWVIVCDIDIAPLRNWDHLFERNDCEILVQRDAEGVADAGFFAVRGEKIIEFAEAWMNAAEEISTNEKAERLDEVALGAVLRDSSWKVKTFERGEVVKATEAGMNNLLDAAVVHLAGMPLKQKTRLAFALHMMWVYGDDDGVFLDILEG